MTIWNPYPKKNIGQNTDPQPSPSHRRTVDLFTFSSRPCAVLDSAPVGGSADGSVRHWDWIGTAGRKLQDLHQVTGVLCIDELVSGEKLDKNS